MITLKAKQTVSSILIGLSVAARAEVTVIHEYRLGEEGSLGTDNRPLDSVGGADFSIPIRGTSALLATEGVFAPGSTAYLDTSSSHNTGWYGADFSTSIPTDNFAFGVFARATGNTSQIGDIFTIGGGSPNGTLKLSLGNNGWASSAHNVVWIGGLNGVVGSLTPNKWVHLALIQKNGTTTFYLDGVAQPGIYRGVPQRNTGHLSVAPGATSYFDGHIDEARVVTFDENASTAEILSALEQPSAPAARPVITSLVAEENGHHVITFRARAGRTYRIEVSTNLEHWTSLNTNVSSASESITFVDTTSAPLNSRLFYRVVEQ